MTTIKTLIESFKADGIAQAISDNKHSAKRSTTFCGVGRSAYIAMLNVIVTDEDDGTLEFFRHQDNAILILSAYADAYRDRLLDKHHLYEALGYIVRGFNAEAIVQHNKTAASPLLVVHCYSIKQNAPAQFTFAAKPAKQPKQKTAAGGKSDAPSASPIDRETATTEQKAALIADLPNPYTEQALLNALSDGSLSMATLKRAVGRYEMANASKMIAKTANRAQSAVDKELQTLMATC